MLTIPDGVEAEVSVVMVLMTEIVLPVGKQAAFAVVSRVEFQWSDCARTAGMQDQLRPREDVELTQQSLEKKKAARTCSDHNNGLSNTPELV